jgi:hypothetical protein
MIDKVQIIGFKHSSIQVDSFKHIVTLTSDNIKFTHGNVARGVWIHEFARVVEHQMLFNPLSHYGTYVHHLSEY